MEKTKPSPEQIAAVALKCIVCSGDIPEARVRRRKDTCSAPCYDLLRHYRKTLFKLWKCPTCLSPNTPQQREEFKRWRQSQGRRVGRGRPTTREAKLANALAAALGLLESELVSLQNRSYRCEDGSYLGDGGLINLYGRVIKDCKQAIGGPALVKPVDTEATGRDSISADSPPAQL